MTGFPSSTTSSSLLDVQYDRDSDAQDGFSGRAGAGTPPETADEAVEHVPAEYANVQDGADDAGADAAGLAAAGGPLAGVRVDGWSTMRNEGAAAERCAACGAMPALLYHGHRLERRTWIDVPGARLCSSCFAARAMANLPAKR